MEQTHVQEHSVVLGATAAHDLNRVCYTTYKHNPNSGTVSRRNHSETSTSAHDRDADGRLAEGDGWPLPAVAVQSPT